MINSSKRIEDADGLRRCPCGSNVLYMHESFLYKFFSVICNNCKRIGCSGKTMDEAIIAWESRRQPSESIQEITDDFL